MKMNKNMLLYRLEQLIILIAHLLLLWWIMYTLQEAGRMTMNEVIIHFTGMAIFGALLIRICAFLAARRFKRAQEQEGL